jgi:hypothetical protein
METPSHFIDEMLEGRFKSFKHTHPLNGRMI